MMLPQGRLTVHAVLLATNLDLGWPVLAHHRLYLAQFGSIESKMRCHCFEASRFDHGFENTGITEIRLAKHFFT